MLLLKSIQKYQDRSMVHLAGSHLRSLSLRAWVCHPNTRIYVRLLGPCFKTGRLKPLRQHPKHGRAELSEYKQDTGKIHVLYPERSHSTAISLAREHMLRRPQSTPPYRSRAITQPKLSPSQAFCPATQTDVDLQKKKCIPAENRYKKERPCGPHLPHSPPSETDFPTA